MNEIAAGLIGFGVAGRSFHAPVIRAVPGLRLKTVVQRSAGTARQVYPEVAVVRDLDALLNDLEIRLVVVATPNACHYEQARRCLLAGRHVVVDKPFTTTSAEAFELIRLAVSKGLTLSVYQNRRFDGDFRTLERLIASGELGRVVRLESRYDRYRPGLRPGAWRERKDEPASGILFDLGPHLIDQALALFGTPQAVAADIRVERDGAQVDDAFDVTLLYPGLRVCLGGSMLACAPGPRYTVHGTLGSYTKHGMDPQEAPLRAGMAPQGDNWGEEPESQWGTLTTMVDGRPVSRRVPTERGDYRLFYANVRDAIQGTAPLIVTAQHAAKVVRVIELARESSAMGRVVDWPADRDHVGTEGTPAA
jgi:predicted dehydrogenase